MEDLREGWWLVEDETIVVRGLNNTEGRSMMPRATHRFDPPEAE